jgi:hypothetical protein
METKEEYKDIYSKILSKDVNIKPINQIVVMKGFEGFCDRLQVLSDCIEYCHKNNCHLCVDWRDSLWGQEHKDFSDYFRIDTVYQASIDDAIQLIKNGGSVFPPWTIEELKEPLKDATHYAKKDISFNGNYTKLPYSVIVHNCTGNRTYHAKNIISGMSLLPSIASIIKARIANIKNPYTTVHLRTTDRIIVGRDAPDRIINIVKFALKKFARIPDANKMNVVVLSDSANAKQEFIRLASLAYPKSYITSVKHNIDLLPEHTAGTHQLSPSYLSEKNITKHNLNIDTLTDFIILCLSDCSVFNNIKSLFSSMPNFIKDNSEKYAIRRWLNAY